jgi:SAM-dependent methyltransferase
MDYKTSQRLIELNRQFYTKFARDFSITRQRLQPGVYSLLGRISRQARILDLGCGNGELLRALVASGFQGHYTGLDFSTDLLREAQQRIPDGTQAIFYGADLTEPGWESQLEPEGFDYVTAFAVLHHLPGVDLRREVLKTVHRLLASGGWLYLSNWQFLQSPRLRKRLQPWESAGFSPGEVDSGDYLLDWRRGGSGLRYVHHFSETSLRRLAENSGFVVRESFLSDGENGQSGLYQIWQNILYNPS